MFRFGLLFEALKASLVVFESLEDLFKFPSLPHHLQHPATDVPKALQVLAEFLELLRRR